MTVEPRLRAAVDVHQAWYDALCALHGVGCRLDDGLWWAVDPPPPLHSGAKTLEPGVTAVRTVAAVARFEHTSVADSFGELDLTAYGFGLLFAARWIYREAATDDVVAPAGWSPVTTAAELAGWNAHFDTAEVLLPGLLSRSSFTVLRRADGDRWTAGAVLQLGTGVVHLSNVWADPAYPLDWMDLVRVACARHPGRALVGYERGVDLEAALAAGFVDVGPKLVWSR